MFVTGFFKILRSTVVFRIVLDKSEQSLEYNWMPEISTTQAVAVDTSLLHTTALGLVLHIVHRQHTEGTFLDELLRRRRIQPTPMKLL